MRATPEPKQRIYLVTLQSKATAAQEPIIAVVRYRSTDYNEAWVGARSVCRLGTNIERKREFREVSEALWDDAAPFPVVANVWTVRNIFVQGTRKRGKQRMTVLSVEKLLEIISQRDVPMTDELRAQIAEAASEGIRITVASARRMGIQQEEDEDGDDLRSA